MKEDIRRIIMAALEALVVKGLIQVRELGLGRYEIRVNGEYYGIYDAERNTFVD